MAIESTGLIIDSLLNITGLTKPSQTRIETMLKKTVELPVDFKLDNKSYQNMVKQVKNIYDSAGKVVGSTVQLESGNTTYQVQIRDLTEMVALYKKLQEQEAEYNKKLKESEANIKRITKNLSNAKKESTQLKWAEELEKEQAAFTKWENKLSSVHQRMNAIPEAARKGLEQDIVSITSTTSLETFRKKVQSIYNDLEAEQKRLNKALISGNQNNIQSSERMIQSLTNDLEILKKSAMDAYGAVGGTDQINKIMTDASSGYISAQREQDFAKEIAANEARNKQVKEYSDLIKVENRLQEDRYRLSTKINSSVIHETQENERYRATLDAKIDRLQQEKNIIAENIGNSQQKADIDRLNIRQGEDLATMQDRVNSEFSKSNNILRVMAENFRKTTSRVLAYSIAYRSLWFAIQKIQEAYQTILELDKAFVDITIVTGYTDNQIKEFTSTMLELSRVTGATLTEIASGSTEWLRQGYSVAETTELLTQSLMFSKLGAMDAADATKYLTSTLKGFQMEVGEASKVVDVFSKLDMAAATSAEELALAFSRTSNAAQDAGVNFETLASYITVVSETTRKSASTIGESFKTLFARYSNVKLGVVLDDEQGEVGINDIEKALSTVNITLRESEDEWRNFDDILSEVGEGWEDFTQLQKNSIVVAMAGVRQSENLRALLNNWEDVSKYMDIAVNSTGTAISKYATYLDSIEGKTNTMIATYQEMLTDERFSEAIKGFVTFIDYLGRAIDKIGLFNIALITLSVAFTALWKLVGDHVILRFAGLVTSVKSVIGAFALATSSVTTFGAVLKSVGVVISQHYTKFILPLIIAFTLLYPKISELDKSFDKLKDTVKELNDQTEGYKSEIASLTEELEKNRDIINELNSVDSSGDEDVQREIQNLQSKNALLSAELELKKNLEYYNNLEAKKLATEALTKSENTGFFNSDTATNPIQELRDYSDEIIKLNEKYIDAVNSGNDSKAQRMQKKIEELGLEAAQANMDVSTLLMSIDEGSALYQRGTEAVTELNDVLTINQNVLNGVVKETDELDYSTEDATDSIEDLDSAISNETTASEEYANALTDLASTFNKIKTVQDEFNELNILSAETIADLISSYPELESVMTQYQLGLADVEDVINSLQDSYDADLIAYKDIMLQKMELDDDLYTSIIEAKDDEIKALQDKYSIEIDDFSSLYASKLSIAANFQKELAKLSGINSIFDIGRGMYDNVVGANNAEQVIKQYEEILLEGVDVNFNDILGASSDSDSSGSNDDPYLQAFEDWYAELKYYYDRGLISSEDYYTKLKQKNDEYFKGKEEYLEEYRQYEVEAISGIAELYKENLDKMHEAEKDFISDNSYDDRLDEVGISDDYIDRYKKMQDQLHELANYYRSLGYNEEHEYITSLQELWLEYQEIIEDVIRNTELARIENEITKTEAIIELYEKFAEDKIDLIDQEADALEDANDELERQLQLQELLEALEDAKSTKLRVYREGIGFVYENDLQAISDAQSDIDEFYNEEKLENEKEYLEEQRDLWEEELEKYKENQELLELEQKAGVTMEKLLQDERIQNLEDFIDEYDKLNKELLELQKQQEDLENGYEETPEGSSVDDIKKQMQANSNAWLTASPEERKRLEAENQRLGQSIGGVFDSGTGTWTFPSSGSSGSSGGSSNSSSSSSSSNKIASVKEQMAKNSQAWLTASESGKKQLEAANKILGASIGGSFDSGTGTWSFANGTYNAPKGLANVDEEGSEIIMNPNAGRYQFMKGGETVFPANISKNLMEWGKISPLSKSQSSGDIIENYNLNGKIEVNANNAQELLSSIKSLAIQRTTKRS